MKKRIDGFKVALEMLKGLDLKAQQHLIEEMMKKDPEMAHRLQEHLISFEDLKFLTTSMMKRLLQEININDLGLALRAGSKELVEHLTSMISTNLKKDLDETLKGKPRALSEVLEAQQRILEKVKILQDKGEIILSKDKSEKFV